MHNLGQDLGEGKEKNWKQSSIEMWPKQSQCMSTELVNKEAVKHMDFAISFWKTPWFFWENCLTIYIDDWRLLHQRSDVLSQTCLRKVSSLKSQIHVSLEGLISYLLRNSLPNMFSLAVLWLQTMVLGESLFWFIKTVLSGIQQVQQGNGYIIKALSHLFCSVDVGCLVRWRDEAVS